MLNKEEKKALRIAFWNEFDDYAYPRRRRMGMTGKWVLLNTGIKSVNLKFDLTMLEATVSVDIISKDLERRVYYYEKFEALRGFINEAFNNTLIWDLEYALPEGKTIARLYVKLNHVNIYDRSTWPAVFEFFFENMIKLEDIYLEYKDIISTGPVA